MDREFTSRIDRLFAECGVTDYYYTRGGAHQVVVARNGDDYVRCVFPCTGSDRRGVANCISFLRRALNLRPIKEERGPAPKRRRQAVKRPRVPLVIKPAPVAVEFKPSWQETLAAHFGVANQ